MQRLPKHRSGLDAELVPRVLIIDDKVEILRSFSRMLRSCDVENAQGGAAAIEILEKKSNFDVVVLDLMMPLVDGQAVLAWMQEHAPHLRERVVLVTAGAFTERAITFLSSWTGVVLEKPVPLNTMRKQVAHLFHTSPGQPVPSMTAHR